VGFKLAIYIALLRGINVGGHNIIKMAELKSIFEDMGLMRVQTYIQSGNVLFESEEEPQQLSHRIEDELRTALGYSVTVVVRTSLELERIIENNPFSAGTLVEGESLYVAFLVGAPSQEGINRLIPFKTEIDDYHIVDLEVYLFFRQSIRNSKLSINLHKLGVQATIRNWKTVNKLAELARKMNI
jgi:uncharacterized protein (DUF1697 family)